MFRRLLKELLPKQRLLIQQQYFCSENLTQSDTISNESKPKKPTQQFIMDVSDHLLQRRSAINYQDFSRTLQAASNSIEILVKVNWKFPNGGICHRTVFSVLTEIYILQLTGKDTVKPMDLIEKSEFKTLCQDLEHASEKLHIYDVIESLKIITHLGLPVDSRISQKLLELINNKLHTMSIKGIVYLDSLLDELQPLTEPYKKLKGTLRKRPNICINWELSAFSMSELADLFSMVVNCKTTTFIEENFLTIIETLWRKRHMLIAEEAMTVLLCLIQLNDFYMEFRLLFERCLRIISNDTKFSCTDLISICEKLIKRSTSIPVFHQEEFFSICGTACVDQNVGFAQATHLQKLFEQINFKHEALSTYLDNLKINENTTAMPTLQSDSSYKEM